MAKTRLSSLQILIFGPLSLAVLIPIVLCAVLPDESTIKNMTAGAGAGLSLAPFFAGLAWAVRRARSPRESVVLRGILRTLRPAALAANLFFLAALVWGQGRMGILPAAGFFFLNSIAVILQNRLRCLAESPAA